MICVNVREHALKLLLDYEENEKYINLSMNSRSLDTLSPIERAQLTSLLYTTVEHKITYDYLIGVFAARSVDKLSLHTKNILRLGLCQLLHIDSIPDFAAVNESVRLTKNKGERALVNAVLRRASDEKGNLPFPDKSKNAARYYSIVYSLPIATVRHFIAMLGEDEAVKLFQSFNRKNDTTLSVNVNKISVVGLLKILADEGYNATRATFSPISIKVNGSFDPRKSAAFSDGLMHVQDEASAISALVLSPNEGETVIDVCSAPGGKSMTMAALSSDGAKIYSFDLHESKLSLIEDSKRRLGFTCVTVAQRDATMPDTELFEKADKVLCDVPCSGLGVISKKPDLRYKDISLVGEELPPLQYKILASSSAYVKSGGTLVYSTCTLNKSENEDVVSSFLAEHPDFYAEDFTVGSLASRDGMLTLYPHIHSTDGFFVAKLRKK